MPCIAIRDIGTYDTYGTFFSTWFHVLWVTQVLDFYTWLNVLSHWRIELCFSLFLFSVCAICRLRIYSKCSSPLSRYGFLSIAIVCENQQDFASATGTVILWAGVWHCGRGCDTVGGGVTLWAGVWHCGRGCDTVGGGVTPWAGVWHRGRGVWHRGRGCDTVGGGVTPWAGCDTVGGGVTPWAGGVTPWASCAHVV